ncbi:universal stress protein, partial [Bacillus sp. D-CC]
MYKQIILACDGSEHALRAAEHATHIAKFNEETNVKVVNPSVVNASLKNGDIDIAEVSADQYPNVSKLKNAQ